MRSLNIWERAWLTLKGVFTGGPVSRTLALATLVVAVVIVVAVVVNACTSGRHRD